jgi:hypothetical protein
MRSVRLKELMTTQSCIACIVAVSLAPAPVWAQQPPPLPPAETLKIFVLEGQGAINNIRTRTFVPPIVEVRDINDRPVEGASVLFELPQAGPGGIFPGQQRSLTVKSNAQGQAVATGFQANDQPGRFNIKVTATYRNQAGRATIAQTNSERMFAVEEKPRTGWSWKRWLIIGGLAGGATAGIMLATGNGGSAATPGQITLIPGTVSIGGPR